MSKEVRTTRDAPTHEDSGADPLGAHQGQLDCVGKKHVINPDSLNLAENEGPCNA